MATAVLYAGLLGLPVSGVAAQTTRMGVFDSQKVSEATEVGKKMQAALTAFQTVKEQEIGDLEQDINTLQERLAKQELSLSSEVRVDMEKDIRRKLLLLDSTREVATREMQLELAAAKSNFEEKLILAVEAFGKEEGFDVLIDSSLVAWANGSVNVTTGIIDRFDKMFPATGQ